MTKCEADSDLAKGGELAGPQPRHDFGEKTCRLEKDHDR